MSIKSDIAIRDAERATKAMMRKGVPPHHIQAVRHLIASYIATHETLSRCWKDNTGLRNYIDNKGI